MPKVFVSHSSKDKEVAGLLVDLFRSALNLSAEEILCTSVEGHRLTGGTETDRVLRTEIRECPAFVGLISSASIESAYVLFELGARWGQELHLLPLLAPGVDSSLLRGPLSGINALTCSSAADLHQMIQELGNLLALTPETPAAYQRRIDELLSLAASRKLPEPEETTRGASSIAEEQHSVEGARDEYAEAEEVIQAHCEREWSDDYSMRAYCIDQQHNAVRELRRGCPADIPETVFRRIRSRCAREWPEDYKMRQYCEDKQFQSYRKLQSR